jgi:hypothetical protein
MGLLTIENLAEGMVLGSDVHDRSGRMLLGSGTELNAKHIRMLRTWGIADADIAGNNEQPDTALLVADVDPACLANAERELLPLFRNAELSFPAMGELFRLCLIRMVRNESR